MLATITGTGDGSAPTVNVTFPYIDKSHVKASIDGGLVSVTWTNTSQVELAVAAPSGSIWSVFRETPTSPALVDFVDASPITEAALDTADTAHRYREEELADLSAGLNSRALQVRPGETIAPLPPASERAGTLLGFSSNGDPSFTALSLIDYADAQAKIADSRAVLAAYTGMSDGQGSFLTEERRGGLFVWKGGNLSANVAADAQQGIYIAPVWDASGASGAWVRHPGVDTWTNVAWFGAVGDGIVDDTAAIQAAVNHVFSQGGGKVYLPAVHLVSEVTIPPHSYAASATSWPTIEIVGQAQGSATFGTIGTVAMEDVGSVIKSTSVGGAVIRVESLGGSFSGVHLVVRNLLVRTYDNPAKDGIDAWNASQFSAYNINVDTGVYSVQASLPTHETKGIVAPASGNGALTRLENVSVSGYSRGIVTGEHLNASGLQLTANKWGIEFWNGSHTCVIERAAIQRCQAALAFSGSPVYLDANINIEHANPNTDINNGGIDVPGDTSIGNGWQVTTSDILDPLNVAQGRVIWHSVLGGFGPHDVFTKSGGKYLRTEQLRKLGDRKVASFRGTANQSIGSGVVTTVVYDAADRTIPDVAWTSGSGVITVQTDGLYRLSAMATFAANATGQRKLHLVKNGAVIGTMAVAANIDPDPTSLQVSQYSELIAGDTVFVWGLQDSGGALDLVAGFDSLTLHLEKLTEPHV